MVFVIEGYVDWISWQVEQLIRDVEIVVDYGVVIGVVCGEGDVVDYFLCD